MRVFGGPADLSGDADFVEEIEHDQDGLLIGIPPKAPHRFDVDANQFGLPNMNSTA
jgi:hypothetical protein